jgi:hypothetical protein
MRRELGARGIGGDKGTTGRERVRCDDDGAAGNGRCGRHACGARRFFNLNLTDVGCRVGALKT